MEKGVIMGLVVLMIGTGGNAAEAGVFHGVPGNDKFQILDLEAGLGEGLRDMKEGEEE